MATVEAWNKYMNLLHEYALVEYDLREAAEDDTTYDANVVAERILYKHFI